jgi:hypothetical protein
MSKNGTVKLPKHILDVSTDAPPTAEFTSKHTFTYQDDCNREFDKIDDVKILIVHGEYVAFDQKGRTAKSASIDNGLNFSTN